MYLRLALNLLTAPTALYNCTQFMWYCGLNPGPCTWWTSTLPTKLRPQLSLFLTFSRWRILLRFWDYTVFVYSIIFIFIWQETYASLCARYCVDHRRYIVNKRYMASSSPRTSIHSTRRCLLCKLPSGGGGRQSIALRRRDTSDPQQWPAWLEVPRVQL